MTGESWPSMLLVTGAYLAMFTIGELLRRRLGTPAEVTRRVDHVVAGCIALTLPMLFDAAWPVVALAVPFAAFLLVTMVAGSLGSVHGISHRSVGALVFPVAIAASFVIAAGNYTWYAVAVLALALGDAAGGIAGSRWGRHTYRAWGQPKTWEGSLAVLFVTGLMTVAVLTIAGEPPLAAFRAGMLTGLVVALVEGALPYGIDNLAVPLAGLASLAAIGSPAASGFLVLSAVAVLALALVASRPLRRARQLAASGGVASNGP